MVWLNRTIRPAICRWQTLAPNWYNFQDYNNNSIICELCVIGQNLFRVIIFTSASTNICAEMLQRVMASGYCATWSNRTNTKQCPAAVPMAHDNSWSTSWRLRHSHTKSMKCQANKSMLHDSSVFCPHLNPLLSDYAWLLFIDRIVPEDLISCLPQMEIPRKHPLNKQSNKHVLTVQALITGSQSSERCKNYNLIYYFRDMFNIL